jgi:maltooligosyltrehalose trehalohydrolase
MEFKRKYPVGAELLNDGTVHFRVWAPECKNAVVCLIQNRSDSDHRMFDLFNENNGYHSGHVKEATEGMMYKFLLNNDKLLPDPASFYQPSGPLGFSQIINLNTFKWNNGFNTLPSRKVIYEMHIGTFTPEGTLQSACKHLEKLSEMGITILELMPVAEFNGSFGWGYDGVQQFAPFHLYGTPDDFRMFIDTAHQHGLGVILDVVYNHLGSEASFFKDFSKDYFSTKYSNEWGKALNFDQENCLPVREYFITNALFWVSEYHIDGFRFDATQQMFDNSPVHIIKEIVQIIQTSFPQKQFFFTAENEAQNAGELQNYGIDAIWNEDFHRCATVAITSRNEAYFSDYQGTPQELLSCIKYGFLFQGQYCAWQKKPRGSPALSINRSNFINYIQNHDQVANTLKGVRISQISSPSAYRCISALLILSPQVPLIFQGQEFCCTSPFYYFSDNPQRAERITNGRKQFLSQFESIKKADGPLTPLPYTPEAFYSSKIDPLRRTRSDPLFAMYSDLLKIRHSDHVFSKNGLKFIDGSIISEDMFCIRYCGNSDNEDRLILCNMGIDIPLPSIPEPVIAPPE